MTRDENIRLRIEAISDLPDIERQLLAINDAIRQQNTLLGQLTTSTTGGSAAQVAAINAVTAALNAQRTASAATAAAATTAGAASTTASTTATTAATAHTAATTAATAGYTSMGTAVRNFTGLIAGAFALNEIKSFGSDIIDAKTKIDSLKISLDVMLGSKKESAELYNDIVKLAKTTPFTVGEVGEQVSKLLAYNVATADLIPTITALGNISAAVGKEKLPQLTLAYGQVATSGRLMLTELRQFSEAGVPLISLIATAYGKTEVEVRKMADAHEISFAMVRKAIMAASEEGGKYANLMSLQAKTVGGEVSNLSDTYLFAKARIGDFYEDTIKNGTSTIADFTNATLGSNSAIQRTVDVVKAAAAGLATLTLITKAQAAADAIQLAYQTTKNVIYGEYLLLQRANTAALIVYTAAETEAMIAAQGFNAALASNPIGLVVAAVGALVTAYYAYQAINDEVTTQLGEQELALKTEQSELNILTKAAMGAAEGTNERKKAIDLLIQKYPDYFRGINSETASNSDLKSILDKVNASYMTRISLARQAYAMEGVEAQQKEFLQKEKEFFDQLPKEISIRFNGDASKLNAALQQGGKASEDLRQQLLNTSDKTLTWIETQGHLLGDNNKRIEVSYTNLSKNIQDTEAARIETAVRVENERWKKQLAGLKKGTDDYKAEEEKHLDALAKINGTYRAAEAKGITDFHKAKEDKAKLSAAEVQAILKTDNAETLDQQLAALNAREKVEVEAANKRAVNAEAARIAIKAIDDRYEVERRKIYDKKELIEGEKEAARLLIQGQKELTDEQKAIDQEAAKSRKESAKETADAIKKTEKEIQDAREETTKISKETAEIESETRNKTIDGLAQMATHVGGLGGQLAAFSLKAFADIDLLSGKAAKAAKDRLDDAQSILDIYKANDDGSKESEAKIAKAEGDVAKAKKAVAETTALTAGAVFQVIELGAQALQVIADTINAAAAARNQAIADALRKTSESLTDLYALVRNANKESLDLILSDTQLSLDQREQAITKHYAAEREMAANQQRIQVELDFLAAVYQAKVDAGGDVKKFMDGVAEADKVRTESTKQFELDKLLSLRDESIQLATEIRDGRIKALNEELDAFKETKEAEIDALNDASNREIDILNKNLTAFKDARNEEVKALEDSLSRQKGLLQVFYSDKSLRLEEDDVFRKQLLDQGEVREVKALEDAKQREIQRATEKGASAEEVSRIIIAFDKLIANKHAEYQTAIGDKTKEVSLANQEVKAQEAVVIEGLETETKNKIIDLQNQIKVKDKETSDEIARVQTDLKNQINELKEQIATKDADVNFRMKMANNDYQESKRRAEYESFESQKALLIAQVQAEIAILRGRRVPASIINDLIAALNQVSGAQNPFVEESQTGVNTIAQAQANVDAIKASQTPSQIVDNKIIPTTTAFTKEGKRVEVTYNPSGKGIDAYDQNANRIFIYFADGYVPETGQRFFRGTDYLRLGKNPVGRDTIPIWANEGERILPTADNKAIGGRDLTNDKLVEKVRGYDLFVARYPQLKMSLPQYDMSQLRLPDAIMRGQSVGQSVDLSAITSKLDSLERTIKNKKETSLQIDERGWRTSERTANSKIDYYGSLMSR